MGDVFRTAAAIDADPHDRHGAARFRASPRFTRQIGASTADLEVLSAIAPVPCVTTGTRPGEQPISTSIWLSITGGRTRQKWSNRSSGLVVALIVDDLHQGTPAAVWTASPVLSTVAPLSFWSPRRVVVVSPHPDDEVLGARGYRRHRWRTGAARRCGCDRRRSRHPRSIVAGRLDLEIGPVGRMPGRRFVGWDGRHPVSPVWEFRTARWPPTAIIFGGGCPKSCVRATCVWRRGPSTATLITTPAAKPWLRWALRRESRFSAIWCGRGTGPTPTDPTPRTSCRRLDSTPAMARKRWAAGAFRSQTRPLGPDPEDAAILPDPVLRRLWPSYEVFVDQRVARR